MKKHVFCMVFLSALLAAFTLISPSSAKAEEPHTGLLQDGDRYILMVEGVFQEDFTGFYRHSWNLKEYYIQNGVWLQGYYGLIERPTTFKYLDYFEIHSGSGTKAIVTSKDTTKPYYYFLQNGINTKYTGFYEHSINHRKYFISYGEWKRHTGDMYDSERGEYLYIENGFFNDRYTGLRLYKSHYENIPDKACYYVNGVRQHYTGLYKHTVNGQYYYLEDGIWDPAKENILGTDEKTGDLYYIGARSLWKQLNYTGLMRYIKEISGYEASFGFVYLNNGLIEKKTFIYEHSTNGKKYLIQDGIWECRCYGRDERGWKPPYNTKPQYYVCFGMACGLFEIDGNILFIADGLFYDDFSGIVSTSDFPQELGIDRMNYASKFVHINPANDGGYYLIKNGMLDKFTGTISVIGGTLIIGTGGEDEDEFVFEEGYFPG